MSKRTRQYIGILAALAAYYLVHEGAHLLYALFTGVFKQINFMGLGVQIDVCAERMTDTQLGIFCLVGALATFCVGYLLTALAKNICRAQSKLLRAVLYYITIAFLLLDPLYLSILCGFFGGGGYERHRPSLPGVGGKMSFRRAAPCQWAGILEADTACLSAVVCRAVTDSRKYETASQKTMKCCGKGEKYA